MAPITNQRDIDTVTRGGVRFRAVYLPVADSPLFGCLVCGVLALDADLHAEQHAPAGGKAQASDKPRLYLAGPVYGKPDSNREAFHAAGVLWQGTQYEVVNPLYVLPDEHEGPCSRRTYGGGQSDGGPNHDASCYMRTDLYALMTCQAVYMLDGWENSRGARTEWAVATALGLTIMYETPPATPWALLALPQAAADQVPRLLANERSYAEDDAYRTALQARRDAAQAGERAGVDMTPEQSDLVARMHGDSTPGLAPHTHRYPATAKPGDMCTVPGCDLPYGWEGK